MLKELYEIKGMHGTKAQEIYNRYCEKYNWDKSKSGAFGNMQLLYARNVDAERIRGVWFISKHNGNYKTVPGKDKWENTIDGTSIIEEYFNGEKPDPNDTCDRIVFVKMKKNFEEGYYFFGICKVVKEKEKNERGNFERRYEQIKISEIN